MASFMHYPFVQCARRDSRSGCSTQRGKDGAAMAGRRMIGILVLLIVIIAAIFLIWYIGSQKTVYDIMLTFHW
jgi:hypothetical protein